MAEIGAGGDGWGPCRDISIGRKCRSSCTKVCILFYTHEAAPKNRMQREAGIGCVR